MRCPNFTILRIEQFRSSQKTRESLESQRPTASTAYEFEFYYTDCEGGLSINGIRYPVKPGGFTCCKPGYLRRLHLPYECFFFNITTQDPEMQSFLDSLPDYGELTDHTEIIDLMEKLGSIKTRTSTEGRLQLSGYICLILGILAQQQYSVPTNPGHSTLLHQQTLLAADKYIREHLGEEMDLEVLAKHTNLHPTYFHKLFTAAFGHTPVQRLYWYRCLKAKEYLRDGSMSIAEIAAECGFSSQSFFTYKFKQLSGITPTQFRKQILDK